MRGLIERISLRQSHDARRYLRSQRRDARWSRLIPKEPFDALLREAGLLAPDRRLRHARLMHDRVGPEPIAAQQHNAGVPNVLLRACFDPRPGPPAKSDPKRRA